MENQDEFKHKKNYSSTYKAKSLAQIPSRFAIEMTDRGWILRNEKGLTEVVWSRKRKTEMREGVVGKCVEGGLRGYHNGKNSVPLIVD